MVLRFVRRHPVWTWIGLVLLLTAILVLVYIPRAIQWGLERWLEREGRITAEIEDVDFNPFTGRLLVQALLAEREAAPGRIRTERATLNIEWWPLTRKRLLLESVTIRDALVTVRQAEGVWYIGGLKIETDEEEAKTATAWRFGFGDIDLQNVTVLYLNGSIRKEILIEEAHLDAMQGWNPERTGGFRLRLQAQGAALSLVGQARPFAAEPFVEGRLETAGFPLSFLQPWLESAEAEIGQGRLSASLDLRTRLLPEEGRLRLALDGSISIADLQASRPGYRLDAAALAWQGQLALAAPRQGKPPLLTVAGRLTSPGMTVLLEQPAMRFALERLSLQGDFAMGTAEIPAGADFVLRLQGGAGPLQAFDREEKLTLAVVRKLSVADFRLAGREATAETLTATGLRLLQRPETDAQEPAHYLSVQRLVLENAGGTPAGPVHIAALRLQGVRGLVVRNAAGEVDLAPWSFAAANDQGGGDAGEKEASAVPVIRIGQIELGGENRLRFVDRSVEPTVAVTLAPLQARLENLDTGTAEPLSVNLQLQANGQPLTVQGTLRPFGEQVALEAQVDLKNWPLRLIGAYLPEVEARQGTASIEGELNLTYAPASERFTARLDGFLGLADVRGAAPDTVLRGGSAAFQGALSLAGGAGASDLRLRGTLRLTDLGGSFGGVGLTGSTATLNGNLSIATAPEAKPRIEIGGNLQLPTLDMTFPDSPLALHGRQGRLQGSFAMNTAAVPKGAPFLVSVSAGQTGLLRIADQRRNLDLFAAAAIEAEKLRVSGPQTFSAASLNVRAPRAVERSGNRSADAPSYTASAEALRASGVRLAEANRLQLTELHLTGLQAMVVRNAQGDFDFGAWPQEPGGTAAEATAAKARPWQVRAGLVAIAGDSRLRYRDFSVEPAVRLELQSLAVRVENLDTAAASPSPFRVEGNFGQYTPLRIDGRIAAIGPPPTLRMTAELQGFSLPEIAGYIEKYLGHTVRSGLLDLKVEGETENGQLQAEATAVLTQLNLEPLGTAERAETERELGFPLNTGLSLLRDDQGTIVLEFPITGDIGSPEVGIAGIVRSAVVKAMRGATLSYLANLGATALGAPVGASFLAKRIFDRFTAVRFRPVAFPPGVAELDPGSREYLREIAAKLEDRPEINIVLCGIATPADARVLPPPATEAKLRQLAQRRSDRVKNALVEMGVEAGRLVLCAPEYLPEEGAEPRVEVGI